MSDILKWSIDPNAELSKCRCDWCGFPMAIYGKRLKCIFKNCIAVTAPKDVIRIVIKEGETANED